MSEECHDLEYLPLDSEAFDLNAIFLHLVSHEVDFEEIEERVRAAYGRAVLTTRVDPLNLALVHKLEEAGFRFVECQLRIAKSIKSSHDVDRFPYTYAKVSTEAMFTEVLHFAPYVFEYDRVTLDPLLGKQLAEDRYRKYLEKSFINEDEEIWCLQSQRTGEILSFRSHRNMSPSEVLLLLGGVHPKVNGLGLGVISAYFCFNSLLEQGVRRATSHISAVNIPILNLEVGHLGFRVEQSLAVFRRIIS